MRRAPVCLGILLVAGIGLAAPGCGGKPGASAAASQGGGKGTGEQLTSGAWTYRVAITQPGTLSEGRCGELRYDGKPLPAPAGINDFVETPWGNIYWYGSGLEAGLKLWDAQGWMRQPRPGYASGRQVAWPPSGVKTGAAAN